MIFHTELLCDIKYDYTYSVEHKQIAGDVLAAKGILKINTIIQMVKHTSVPSAAVLICQLNRSLLLCE